MISTTLGTTTLSEVMDRYGADPTDITMSVPRIYWTSNTYTARNSWDDTIWDAVVKDHFDAYVDYRKIAEYDVQYSPKPIKEEEIDKLLKV